MPKDIYVDMKRFFFDRKVVIEAVGKAKRQSLSKIGAFVRRRARSLTGKRSKNSAPPGKPPKMHIGLLHDRIQFGYDVSNASVVIGPERINGGSRGEAPRVLEFGGEEVITIRGKQISSARQGLKVRAYYAGNPFMAPSLKAEIDAGTVSSAWKDSVKGK